MTPTKALAEALLSEGDYQPYMDSPPEWTRQQRAEEHAAALIGALPSGWAFRCTTGHFDDLEFQNRPLTVASLELLADPIWHQNYCEFREDLNAPCDCEMPLYLMRIEEEAEERAASANRHYRQTIHVLTRELDAWSKAVGALFVATGRAPNNRSDTEIDAASARLLELLNPEL